MVSSSGMGSRGGGPSWPDIGQLSQQELRSLLQDHLAAPLGLDGPWTPPSPAADVTVPDPPQQVRIVVVRVDVDGARPPVWRRLRLRGDVTMDRLHDVIQAAMGWWGYHLHRFWLGPDKRLWTGPYLLTDFDVDEGEQGLHERDVRVDQLLREVGDRVFYTYDYGDEWNHTIKVETFEPMPPDVPAAVCTGGRRNGPMEDIGGIHAHNDLVATHHDDAGSGWAGEYVADPDWDPVDFDVDAVNDAIEMVAATPDERMGLADTLLDGATVHPAVADLQARAPRQLRDQLAAAARVDTPVGEELRAAAVRPLQVLLELAGDDGIPLTAAGWMKPAAVTTLFDQLGMGAFWIGKGNREDQTQPVHLLRTTARDIGLVRKRNDRLLTTPTGRDAHADPGVLWQSLVDWLIPPDSGPERDATVLMLASVASHGEVGPDLFDQVATQMSQLGWQVDDGQPVDRWAAMDAAEQQWRMLGLVRDAAAATGSGLAAQAVGALAATALQG